MQFLTTLELAERWNVSKYTLEGWRWKGKGPAFIKLGGVKYPIDEVEKYEREVLNKKTNSTARKNG